jgi:hypothetical protein
MELSLSYTQKNILFIVTTMKPEIKQRHVGCEVFTAVVMKSSIFWVIRCSLLKAKAFACYQRHSGFLLGLFFDPENGRDMFL